MSPSNPLPLTEQIRTRLLARRAELVQRLERVEHDASHRAEAISADFQEQANQTSNDEVLGAIGETARAEIQDIDTALERVAAGRYGLCSRCGVPIETARLAVVPYTVTCSSCATD